MIRTIVLDAGPLGLIAQRPGVYDADACRVWLGRQTGAGVRVVVPEVADYELRRELTRIRAVSAIRRLDYFIADEPDRYLPITTDAMRYAAVLWADVRNCGLPTADPKELDGDAILAAQVLTSEFAGPDAIVATTNVAHLARFLPAREWSTI